MNLCFPNDQYVFKIAYVDKKIHGSRWNQEVSRVTAILHGCDKYLLSPPFSVLPLPSSKAGFLMFCFG